MESNLLQNFDDVNHQFLSDGKCETENPEFKLKIITFADKSVDLIMTRLNPKKIKEKIKGVVTSYQRDLSEAELEAKRLENIDRSARRAKLAVHHLVRQIGADHMLTLTTRENITDKAQFFEVFSRFIRLVREKDYFEKRSSDGTLIKKVLITRSQKRPYAYVAVPELQERGAYHMHIACVGRQDINLLRSCWYVALGGSVDDVKEAALGQVDVQFNKKRFSGESEIFKTFKLVGYLTKYISKSFEVSHQLGEKRYSSARSIPKPIVQKQHLFAMFDYGDKSFIAGMQEVLNIADFIGVRDLQLWNRGLDVFIARGYEA